MVPNPSSLASTLTRETPEELLIAAKKEEIRAAINKGEKYRLKDELGRVFIIEPNSNGQ